jgi:hypothetical protein
MMSGSVSDSIHKVRRGHQNALVYPRTPSTIARVSPAPAHTDRLSDVSAKLCSPFA